MFKIISAFLILAHSYALWAANALPNKTEVELKVALTKTGYTMLKTAMKDNYDYESSERTDYYFDYFANKSYVLKNLDQPVKLRMMVSDDAQKWQNQTVIKTAARSIFSIKTTTAAEIELKHDKALIESLELYMLKLSEHDQYALNLATSIQKSMEDMGLLKKDGHRYFLTHFNHKKRTKIKLKLGSEQFSVQVGETNNRGDISYEMEAEVKKGDDINKSADVLNKWLQSQGFLATHIDISVPTEPTDFSEKILNELFVL